jgi:hypothetical protein
MKISRSFRCGVALVSLAISGGCAGTTSTRTGGASIPPIAEIGGVQIGYATQEDLARAWGEGLTVTGGHPNSGRLWRVRDTDWIVATDGFTYSDRGLVIDALQLEPQRATPLSINAPIAKLDQKGFAWLGEISQGMTRLEVIASLNRHTLKFKEDGAALIVDADGFSEITSEANANIRHWRVTLFFEEGKMSGLRINAGPAGA